MAAQAKQEQISAEAAVKIQVKDAEANADIRRMEYEAGFTGEKMGVNVIETLDNLFKTWKPREKYEFINVTEVDIKLVANHKLLY